MSDRFFYPGPIGPGEVTLEGQEAHHIANVRRFGTGDALTLFNGDGHEYPAVIVDVAKKRVRLQITNVQSPDRELRFSLHIASALPKGDRGDFLIEKLTELGVTEFTPLITDRSVVKANDAKSEKLERAVIEASKQCGRNKFMRVHSPARWIDWCHLQTGLRLIANPGGTSPPTTIGEGVLIAIGPEGGFSQKEIDTATGAGWKSIALGSRILRVETAAIAAAALVSLSAKC